LGENGLIGAIGAPLSDFFGEYSYNNLQIFEIYIYKKVLLFFKVFVKNLPQICHFQNFPSPFLV
jgi:hypothetical protein